MRRTETNILIKCLASDLEVHQTAPNQVCPFCKDTDKTFSITRFPNGLVYNCFRAKCTAKGFVDTSGDALVAPVKHAPNKPPPVFKYRTRNFTDEEVLKYFGKYELTKAQIRLNQWVFDEEYGRVYMPVLNFSGFDHGGVAKVLPGSTWKGSKAINYHSGVAPAIHYAEYDGSTNGDLVWCAVTEDIISAVKVSEFIECASILGTSMSDAAAKDLADHYDNLLIILDPGAEAAAQTIAKERALQFKKIKVLFLKQDPKDTNKKELEKAINGAINPSGTASKQSSVH